MRQLENTAKKKIIENKIAGFLRNTRWYLIAILLVLIVVTVTAAIVNHVTLTRNEKIADLFDRILAEYSEYTGLKEGEDGRDLLATIESDLQNIIDTYRSNSTVPRAILLKGNIKFDAGYYDEAFTLFEQLYTRFPKSALAPQAVFNSAVCREELNDDDKAVELYRKVYDDYIVESPIVPHALFALGRMYENVGNFTRANETYTLVLDEFSTSDWANFAQTRIIQIKKLVQ